jgi:hypothetical protein
MRVVGRGRDRGANTREAQAGVGRRARARVLAPHDRHLDARLGEPLVDDDVALRVLTATRGLGLTAPGDLGSSDSTTTATAR